MRMVGHVAHTVKRDVHIELSSKNMGQFLTSWGTVSFTSSILHPNSHSSAQDMSFCLLRYRLQQMSHKYIHTISEYMCSTLSEPHNHMHSTLSEPHNHMYSTMSEPHNHKHSTVSEPHNHMHSTMSEPHNHMCHTMSEPHNHMYIFLHSTSTVRFSSNLNTIQYARKNTRFSTTYTELHNMYCSTDTLYSRIQEGWEFAVPIPNWLCTLVCAYSLSLTAYHGTQHWQCCHTPSSNSTLYMAHGVHIQTHMVTSWPPCTNPIMENKAYECPICDPGKIIQLLQLSHSWLWCWPFGRNLLAFQRNILLALSGYAI